MRTAPPGTGGDSRPTAPRHPRPLGDPRNPLDPPEGGSLSSPFSAPLPTPRSFLRRRPRLPETRRQGPRCQRLPRRPHLLGPRSRAPAARRAAAMFVPTGSSLGAAAAGNPDSPRSDTLSRWSQQRPAAGRPHPHPRNPYLTPGRSRRPLIRCPAGAGPRGRGQARTRLSQGPAQAQRGPKFKNGLRTTLVASTPPPPRKPC